MHAFLVYPLYTIHTNRNDGFSISSSFKIFIISNYFQKIVIYIWWVDIY